MASTLNPYLAFRGNAREAMEFYRSVLGGELTVTTFAEFGQADEPFADQVMHSMLVTPAGFTLMASDTPPGMEHTPGTTISLSLFGDDEAELRGYFEGLSAAGAVTMPLERQVWGDTYGQCVDRFGIGWMVNISTPAQ